MLFEMSTLFIETKLISFTTPEELSLAGPTHPTTASCAAALG